MKVTERKGSFVKQFRGPGENEIVCFKFWQAVVAEGCPGRCSYCFLQTSPAFVFREDYDLMGTLYRNLPDLEGQVRAWLKGRRQSAAMIVGENQDGLAFESPYAELLGVTPLQILTPLFERENPHGHELVVLSKFTQTRYAEEFGPARRVIYSWSLSLPSISERFERGVASLKARLEKAAEMKEAGYRVRFRLDALAPVPGWRDELEWVMGRINEVAPEMLTIGAVRATNTTALRNAAERNGRDPAIFDYIATRDASGFKDRTEDEFHRESFRVAKKRLAPGVRFGLCKEDLTVWQEVGAPWAGCHCLGGERDLVTVPKLHLLERTKV